MPHVCICVRVCVVCACVCALRHHSHHHHDLGLWTAAGTATTTPILAAWLGGDDARSACRCLARHTLPSPARRLVGMNSLRWRTAQVLDLRADDAAFGEAVVIDARVTKAHGVVIDVVARSGSLSAGGSVASYFRVVKTPDPYVPRHL